MDDASVNQPAVRLNEPAPDFTAVTTNGELTLSDLRAWSTARRRDAHGGDVTGDRDVHSG